MCWQYNELNCLQLAKQIFLKTPDGEKLFTFYSARILITQVNITPKIAWWIY
ncbi:hypothetical protein GXM_03919 [Nostoc sphaeroides CCNUC1]|uniref:Uncharacterized protein n=1 Tax=Nostoc sphaeroides CCNUC1 TaxID=2653204 RepID=A0A5P8W146_9NOSO|nr:hypothetical protein GXM_03919 [Nostoc sphaeroides CCNUC1]